jgi:hypothetical protein
MSDWFVDFIFGGCVLLLVVVLAALLWPVSDDDEGVS